MMERRAGLDEEVKDKLEMKNEKGAPIPNKIPWVTNIPEVNSAANPAVNSSSPGVNRPIIDVQWYTNLPMRLKTSIPAR